MSTVKTFYVIADCHGLENIHETTSTVSLPLGYYVERARSNPQRHAVAAIVTMFSTDNDDVKQACKRGGPCAALRLLHIRATSVKVSEAGVEFWRSIPNDATDPFSQEEITREYQNGKTFGVPKVLQWGNRVIPIDGKRRIKAAETVGMTVIPADIATIETLPDNEFFHLFTTKV